MNSNYAPYNQDAIISQPLDSNQLDTTNDDYRIMNDDSLPGPVKQIWSSIKDKQLFLTKQKQLNTVFINDYQQRDSNIEIINYINLTWQNVLMYNLKPNIIKLFKTKLLELNSMLKIS
jgi:hypothetical protein